MTIRTEPIAVSMPGLRVVHWWTDEPHVGLKERYVIARVETGRASFWSGGEVYETGPGSLEIQQPGSVHRDLTRDGPSAFQVISFPAKDVERVTGKVQVRPQLQAGDPRGAAFHRLHDAVRARADRFALEVAVAEAISALAFIVEAPRVHTAPVRRAIELLQAQLAEPVTLDQLAAHAGLDKFHLCRAFRAQVGLPPHAYLTSLRIMRAKALLASGVKPSDLAPQLGLYDQSQLNRHFLRIVGTTPGRYARSI